MSSEKGFDLKRYLEKKKDYLEYEKKKKTIKKSEYVGHLLEVVETARDECETSGIDELTEAEYVRRHGDDEQSLTMWRMACFALYKLQIPNYGVGTPVEKNQRFKRFCEKHKSSCLKCPAYHEEDDVPCSFHWMELPYDKEDEEVYDGCEA